MRSPDRDAFFKAVKGTELERIGLDIVSLLDEKYSNPKHGHYDEWHEALSALPNYKSSKAKLDQDIIQVGNNNDLSTNEQQDLETKLKLFSPWRKGPFKVLGIHIDTEWRSDWKWSRIDPHIQLNNKLVLDIGCGNGYYALRMLGKGARLVVGIDPSWLYVFQFHALQKYIEQEQQAFVLPFTLEEFPVSFKRFDTIFSMGVLYHRQEPQLHLQHAYELLASNGQFVLETLIIDDKNADVLIPNDRYANMRNVWMIPSINLLETWLIEAGFKEVQVIDITMTTIQEQRQTEWMTRYSLEQALKADDHNQTIEGYPAPLRVSIIASK